MENNSSRFRTLVALALAVAIASPLAACTAPTPTAGGTPTLAPTDDPDAVSTATRARFQIGEVTNYKGMNLSPAIGPNDNSIKGIQHVDLATYRLAIDGQVDTPLSLAYGDVTALEPFERLIVLHCVTGWNATILWKGVLLDDLIALAGPKDSAVTVVFTSVDGYTTSLPLATVRGKGLILAYQANGLALPAELGYPFIVVAEDKFGYKWARWVTAITLSDDPDYKGYWESRGYDNTADIG